MTGSEIVGLALQVLGGVSVAVAGVLGPYALVVKARTARSAGARQSLPPAQPRRQLDSAPESLGARVSRLEERQASTDRRITSCEEDVRGVQEDQNEMNEKIHRVDAHVHVVEKGAIERLGTVAEKLATFTGALSTRKGGR